MIGILAPARAVMANGAIGAGARSETRWRIVQTAAMPAPIASA